MAMGDGDARNVILEVVAAVRVVGEDGGFSGGCGGDEKEDY